MSALLRLLFEYLTLWDVLLYFAILLATWLLYKAGIEPFLSPVYKVALHGRTLELTEGCCIDEALQERIFYSR